LFFVLSLRPQTCKAWRRLSRNSAGNTTCPRQSNDGGSSQGFGYTARALLERRVTSNWFVGTAIDIQQAKDYAPSHFLLYVRYSAAGWQGDMDLPPQPLKPYAND
jgi:hypothetical protein